MSGGKEKKKKKGGRKMRIQCSYVEILISVLRGEKMKRECMQREEKVCVSVNV